MAKLTTEELLEQFAGLTLVELNDFVKAFEEKFEVTAAAPVAVAGAAGGVGHLRLRTPDRVRRLVFGGGVDLERHHRRVGLLRVVPEAGAFRSVRRRGGAMAPRGLQALR